MAWMQPLLENGTWVLREMSHPCPEGCSGWWKLPAAEQGGVVPGLAAEANGHRPRLEANNQPSE